MDNEFSALADKKIIHVSAWAKTFTQHRMPLLKKLQQNCRLQVIYCPDQKDHVAKLIDAGFNVKTGCISPRIDIGILKQTYQLYTFLKKKDSIY